MQDRALQLLLAAFLVALGLASCGSTPSLPSSQEPSVTAALAAVGTATPQAVPSATAMPRSSDTPFPPPLATATPTPSPTPTQLPRPTATTTLSPTATPTTPLATPATGQSLPLSLGWRFGSNGHLSDAAIYGPAGSGFVVSSLDRYVHALTSQGKIRWQARVAGPAYVLTRLDGDRVAIGDDAGRITVLDDRGRRLWRHDLGGRVTALHGGWPGGLLAGGWDERLTSLSLEDGSAREQWQVAVDGPVSGIASVGDLALAATLDGDLLAFDHEGGAVWRTDVGVTITGLGVLDDSAEQLILAGVQDGRLLAFSVDGDRIRLRWQQGLGTGGPVWQVADLGSDSAPEIVVGMGGADPLLALLSADGQVLWRLALPSAVGAVATLDLDSDGKTEILAGLADGGVHAFDAQGRLRASVNAGLPVWGLEAAPDGTALVLADVGAWHISGAAGQAGSSWLPPPTMADVNPDAPLLGAGDGATLVFLGDVALGRTMEAQLARYGPTYPWQGLAPLLQEADLAMANLECVLTRQGSPLDKEYLIRAHPRWGQTLVDGGFHLVTIANNHALDFGHAGLDEMQRTLSELGIAAVGAGASRDTTGAQQPGLFVLNGVRVAVLGYAAARWNGSADVPATGRIAWAEVEKVQADVRAVRDRADLVVVLLHAGTEYAAKPSKDQVAVAHAAIDAGADLVVGHHPHVTQTVERYGEGLIVYSLGDAVFDIPRPAAMQGDLLRVHATQDGLAQAELWPFWIEDAIRPRLLADEQGAPRVKIVYP